VQIFISQRASCLWFIKITKQKKFEKSMQCPTIKSLSLSFGIGFFFKYIKYVTFIVKFFLNIFLMKLQLKNFNFQTVVDAIDVYQ
jgi:hypothetical protein